ncbi:MAG: helix-turn-helix domain-containing protein [Planctomycetes bacterium]|nr:helix-turn-helix domain-containing protein [Planctomycetota bacterium]
MRLEHYTTDYATGKREFRVSNSQANTTCINNHFYYGPHQHSGYFDWLYVVEGEIHETINGKRYVFTPGDILWARPGDWHEESAQDMRFYALVGTSIWLEGVMEFLRAMDAYQALCGQPDPPICNVPPDQRESLSRKWLRCWELHVVEQGAPHVIQLVSEVFVNYFMPLVRSQPRPRGFPAWLQEAMLYIQNHAGEDLTSERLAEVCGKSPEHVARTFRRHLGSTPSQYINLTRLAYAARLLAATDRPIIDIAMDAGFGTLGYFYRQFKTRYRRSPREYRLWKQRA